MDIDFVLVGSRIRDARIVRGVTGDALSEQIGIAAESLRHIECGASKPSLQTLYRIAEVLGVSLDYLTGRTPGLSDSLLHEYGLEPMQEKMLREVLDGMIPIITNYI